VVQNWHDELSTGWCLCLRGDRVVGCGTRGLQRSGSFLGVSFGGPVDALCRASAKVFSVDILGACEYSCTMAPWSIMCCFRALDWA